MLVNEGVERTTLFWLHQWRGCRLKNWLWLNKIRGNADDDEERVSLLWSDSSSLWLPSLLREPLLLFCSCSDTHWKLYEILCKDAKGRMSRQSRWEVNALWVVYDSSERCFLASKEMNEKASSSCSTLFWARKRRELHNFLDWKALNLLSCMWCRVYHTLWSLIHWSSHYGSSCKIKYQPGCLTWSLTTTLSRRHSLNRNVSNPFGITRITSNNIECQSDLKNSLFVISVAF